MQNDHTLKKQKLAAGNSNVHSNAAHIQSMSGQMLSANVLSNQMKKPSSVSLPVRVAGSSHASAALGVCTDFVAYIAHSLTLQEDPVVINARVGGPTMTSPTALAIWTRRRRYEVAAELATCVQCH